MSPAQVHRFLRRLAGQQTVNEAGRIAVAATYAVIYIQLGGGRLEGLAVNPGDRTPTVTVGGMHLTQGGGDNLHLWMVLGDAVDHSEKSARIELRFRGDFGPGNAESHLQI